MNATVEKEVTILSVDDSPDSLLFTKTVLGHSGYKVVTADTSEKALFLARKLNPDIVLLDVVMPHITGLDICRRLKGGNPNFQGKIILLTAMTEMEDKVSGFKCGADDYITKPFQSEELLARVENQVRTKKMEDRMRHMAELSTDDLRLGGKMQEKLLTNGKVLQNEFGRLNYDIGFYNRMPYSISGDFFMVKPINDVSAGLFFADTCGHGVSAALISMRITALIEQLDSPINDASRFLDNVNTDLYDIVPKGRFVAATYLILNGGHYSISTGAQPSPIFLRNGKAELLDIFGSPVGIDLDAYFSGLSGSLETGDGFFLYTDGVTDLEGHSGLYGHQRIMELLEQGSKDGKNAQEIVDAVAEDLNRELNGKEPEDDITMVFLVKK